MVLHIGWSLDNLVLKMHVSIDRNLYNGVEIHIYACGRSVIMMRLSIVKSAMNGEYQEYYEENIPHGKKFLKELVMPWANTDRIVCTESYFVSVPAAEELLKNGLRFIGVIKTATWQFLMAYMSNIAIHNRGDMSRLLTSLVDSTKTVLGDFIWMDRNR